MQLRWICATLTALLLLATGQARAADFTLSSPQLQPGGTMANAQVFNGFGCSGRNISPELDWHGEPANTKSFAITVYDPDAPTGSGWWHWVIFNIPASVHHLAAGAGDPASGLAPAGAVQSRTDFGRPGYGGACPPAGDAPHHYLFTIYALDTASLPLDSDASPAMVGFYLHQHALAQARIMVTYGR